MKLETYKRQLSKGFYLHQELSELREQRLLNLVLLGLEEVVLQQLHDPREVRFQQCTIEVGQEHQHLMDGSLFGLVTYERHKL